MASTEAKARRKAVALADLDRLSGLLGEHLDIEVPNVRSTHRDPELQSIQRVESVNALLAKVLDAVGVKADDDLEGKTKAELLELAESKGVEISRSAKKAEIIEALRG
jgi:hypothetical protein